MVFSFVPAGARERLVPKIALCFLRLFVRLHLSRAQYITSYVTMQLKCLAAFGGLQAKLQQKGSFVLPRWRKRGR